MKISFNKKLLLIVFSVLLSSGCSAPLHVTMNEGATIPNTNKSDVGYIYIYRESEFIPSAIGTTLNPIFILLAYSYAKTVFN